MNVQIEESWKQHIGAEFEKPYFSRLVNFVRQEYSTTTCYPPGREIFNAFNLCPFDRVKVVIIGQDPYHEPGQAEGLCFSVKDGVMMPPSLINIFKEIKDDLGTDMPRSGSLRRWAEQGDAAVECHADGEGASGGFASAARLGGIHGRRDSGRCPR